MRMTYGPIPLPGAKELGVFAPLGVSVLSIRPISGVAGDENSALRFVAEPFIPAMDRALDALGVKSPSLYNRMISTLQKENLV